MLIIILGIIVAVVLAIVTGLIAAYMEKGEDACELGCALVMLALMGGIIVGLFYPTGWNERELVSETKLVSLNNSTASEGHGSLLYVSVSAGNVYSYRYKVETELGTDTSNDYVTRTLSGNNIIESEDINCKTPVLLKYETKSKITIWSFGFGETKTEYVFRVPEGTIKKVVELK